LHFSEHDGRQQLDEELEQHFFFEPFIEINTTAAITKPKITSIMKSITPGSVQAIVYDFFEEKGTFTRRFLSF
jgi:hypothetical protein